MNYCKYRQSDGYILEISSNELFPEGENQICLTTIDNIDTHHMYVIEVNQDNILVAHRGYLKEV